MRTPTTLLFAGAVSLAACGGNASPAPAHDPGQASGATTLEWKVSPVGSDMDVTLVVDGQPTPLGRMSAVGDDSPGTPADCEVRKNPTPDKVSFGCGGTPAYHYYEAALANGSLVVTLVEGVDMQEGSEKRAEVKRIPVKGASLKVIPYAASRQGPTP